VSFDPKVVLAAIEACVTVVKPGEVLAVRVPLDLSEYDFDSLRREAERVREGLGVRILFVAGEEFARIADGGAL
jgi:hypothetical protein